MTGYDLTYLSLGAGVQSSALLVCSALGLHGVPKVDVAIFADTGDEPHHVYGYLEILRGFGIEHGIPLIEVRSGRGISSDFRARMEDPESGTRAGVPLFTRNEDGSRGMLRRSCTREYKLDPIFREVRKRLGAEPGGRVPRGRSARCLIGISTDEAHRAKPSPKPYIENHYPLLDADISRSRCHDLVTSAGLPRPRKSACVFCPYHDNLAWQDLKVNHPHDFSRAVAFDRAVRDSTNAGEHAPAFVHKSCKPLDEVDFIDDRQGWLFDGIGFGNECEGMCGV